MKIEELVKLVEAIKDSNFDEFSLEAEGVKISLKRGGQVVVAPAPGNAPAPQAQVNPVAQEAPAPAAEPVKEEGLVEVLAPMVGTFYEAPSPGAEPFAKPGSKVKPGDTLCILEAMKLMNEIQAEMEGEVVEVAVKNGELVEYGQVIMTLRPTRS